MNGEPVDLGFTFGAMTANTVRWTYEGVDYTLASQNLTEEELVTIARSVNGTAVK